MKASSGLCALVCVSLSFLVSCSPRTAMPEPPPAPPVDVAAVTPPAPSPQDPSGQPSPPVPPSPPAPVTPKAAVEERREGDQTGRVLPGAAAPARAQESMALMRGSIAHPLSPPFNTEAYDYIQENSWKLVSNDSLSTFSVDVDTASYANVRRFLNGGQRPPADAVRIEELLNYFRYDYPAPSGPHPFSVTTELGPCPWQPNHRLLLVGLQGRRIDSRELPPRNLVFLIDVSGSMMAANKLPLVKASLAMLANNLTASDRVAIAVYAGASGLVLPSTPGSDRERILGAIASLQAGGSTNGAAGIELAYREAQASFIKGGVNRVILATDGDFNVGVTDRGSLVRLIEQKRAEGVALSVLGYGMGNLKDATLEQLADKGNGNYAYIDSLQEANKVLVTEAGGTLVTIAKDVKLQLEFNPQHVAAFRLIGYENRVLAHQDFKDDTKDAGEIGAGHSVTALYEIVPQGVALPNVPSLDPLKYQTPTGNGARSDEWLTVKLRYKQPEADTSVPLDVAVTPRGRPAMTANLGFASAVAAFGMSLRDSAEKGSASFTMAIDLARRYRGDDPHGHRAEFARLAEIAAAVRATTSQ